MRLSFLGVVFVLQCFGIGPSEGAEKLLNEACESGDTCVDISGTSLALHCDSYYKRCLIETGQPCTTYPAFCVSGATCESGTCICGTGLNPDAANKKCTQSTNSKPKGDCSTDAGPCNGETGSTCTSGVCTCDAGYKIIADGSCAAVGANTIGASCTTTSANAKGSCSDANAVCSATTNGQCICKAGYSGTDGGSCSVTPHRVGGLCKVSGVPAQETCGNYAVCSANTNGVCQCPTGFTGNNGDSECTPAAGRIEGSCSGTPCQDTTNAACVSNLCKCKDGFNAAPGAASCNKIPDGKLNAACDNADKRCAGTNVYCKDEFCACREGFSGNKGDDDCIKQTEGGASGNVLCSLLLLATISMAVLFPTVN